MEDSGNGRDDLPKLRRFALAVGVVLFTYAIAGVELKSPAEISPLGIPLVVRRPNILGIGLVITSVYATLRYWYYGTVRLVSPVRARRDLRHRRIPGGDQDLIGSGGYSLGLKRYFPRFRGREATVIGQPGKPELSMPLGVRALACLEDIDFTAPIWVNVIALATYAVARLTGWGALAWL